MERMVFKDLHALSTAMLYDALNFSECISAICYYDLATALLSELIQSEVSIGQINISDYEWNGYDKEYAVTIMDGCLYCNPTYGMKKDGYSKDGYLETYADVAYIHQDCNSKFLQHLECDKTYEFAVEEFDDTDDTMDFDDRYTCCNYCSETDDHDNIVTHHSDSVTVCRDKNGNPTGFSKSWIRDNGCGVTQYCNYSYYCNNEDMLRSMAQDLGIDL